MDVLIVSTNRCAEPFVVMPYGACLVAEAAERAEHRVRFLDFLLQRDPLQALRDELTEARPDVVGLSVRNLDNNNMRAPEAYYEGLQPTVSTIRKHSDATVVLGGGAVAVMPQQLLKYSGADWADRARRKPRSRRPSALRSSARGPATRLSSRWASGSTRALPLNGWPARRAF